jgi:hypothetical protein
MRDGWKGQDRLARAVDDLSGGLVVVGAGLGVASEPGTLAILQRERESVCVYVCVCTFTDNCHWKNKVTPTQSGAGTRQTCTGRSIAATITTVHVPAPVSAAR